MQRLVALVCGVVAALWVAMSFTYPFGWDQGLFAWVGGAIVHGDMPYRDAWDFKGPLVYYTFALAQWLFGVHLWSIRVLDTVLLGAATFSVFRAAVALLDKTAAGWAALVFLLWYGSNSYWHTSQPDGWAGMLLITALAPVIARPAGVAVSAMTGVGLAIGIATLLKPHYAVFLLVPFVHIHLSRDPKRLAAFLGVSAGWLAPIALTASWFASRGALNDLIEVHLKYSSLYVGVSPGDRLRGVVDYFLGHRVITVALPAALYGVFVLWQRRRAIAIMLTLWAALVTMGVVLQNRFYTYHWLPLLPAAVLLVAVGLFEARTKAKTFAHVIVAVILLHCLAPIVLEESRFLLRMTGRSDVGAYYDAYGEPGDDMRTVQWLRETGEPGDIFVFGWHSAVAWLSERRFVSRFGYSLPLMMGEGTDIRAQYRAELLAALRDTPPRYIIVGPQSERILGRQMTLADFPEFVDLLERRYRERARVGKLTIYEDRR